MNTINGWKARRTGAAMTVEGVQDGKPVKVTRVAEIATRDGQTIATRDDGTEWRLS